jgi:predicted RNase H-like HicB family nuclease
MMLRRNTVAGVGERLTFHVEFDDAGDGWTLARVREVPAIVTQGATTDEARDMVRSALRDWLEHYVADEATDQFEPGRPPAACVAEPRALPPAHHRPGRQ